MIRAATRTTHSTEGSSMDSTASRRPLVAAGTLLGMGMGGFIDGILLHQLLQVHNMLSATHRITGVEAERLVVNLEINMFWDGLFHAFCWIMTSLGLALLWSVAKRRDVPLSTKTFSGSLVLGWGIFNLVEGIIDHHILHIHHVIEQPGHEIWDYSFLGFGVLLVLIGWALIRSARHDQPHDTQTSPAFR